MGWLPLGFLFVFWETQRHQSSWSRFPDGVCELVYYCTEEEEAGLREQSQGASRRSPEPKYREDTARLMMKGEGKARESGNASNWKQSRSKKSLVSAEEHDRCSS